MPTVAKLLNRAKLASLMQREQERFVDERPKSKALFERPGKSLLAGLPDAQRFLYSIGAITALWTKHLSPFTLMALAAPVAGTSDRPWIPGSLQKLLSSTMCQPWSRRLRPEMWPVCWLNQR